MPTVVWPRRLTLLGYLFWFIVYWRGGQKIVRDFREPLGRGGLRVDRAAVVAIALSSVGLAVTGIAFAWRPSVGIRVTRGLFPRGTITYL